MNESAQIAEKGGNAQVTSIAQFRALRTANLDTSGNLRLEAVVIWADPTRNLIRVKDETGWMDVPVNLPPNGLVKSAQRVMLEGAISPRQVHYPELPSGAEMLTKLEIRHDARVLDNLVTRTRGYIHPPGSGEYVFWVAGDDCCELRLSSDADPKNARTIAMVDDWTTVRGWDQNSVQRSNQIRLEAGKRYYIEVRHFNKLGINHFAVAWEGPGIERCLIEGRYLSPWKQPSRDVAGKPNDDLGFIFHEQWTDLPGLNRISKMGDFDTLLNAPPRRDKAVEVNDVRIQVLGEWSPPEPVIFEPGQIVSAKGEEYQWGEIEGEVTFSSSDALGSVLELATGARRAQVHVMNTDASESAHELVGARICARGFCQSAIDESGASVVTKFWAPSPANIEMRDPLAGGWAKIPMVSLLQLNDKRSAMLDGRRIRLRSTITEVHDDHLILHESGDAQVSGYISTDGKRWDEVGTTVVKLGRSAFSGLAASAHDKSNGIRAEFSEVSGLKPAWKNLDIGNPSHKGSAVAEGSGFLIKAGGLDVWDDIQQFHFLSQPMAKTGSIVTQLKSITGGEHSWTKAGIMLREALTENGTYVFLALTRNQGAVFQYRATEGGRSSSIAPRPVRSAKIPSWLKLTWTKNESTLKVKPVFGKAPFDPGDTVEVVGILEWLNQEPVLTEAFVRSGDQSRDAGEILRSPESGIDGAISVPIQHIQQLPVNELEKANRVRVRGVIVAKYDNGLVLHDSTGGMFVHCTKIGPDRLVVGQFVEVDGSTAAGGFSPVLHLDSYRHLGEGKIPEPIQTSPNEIMASRRDCQWVELRGIVRRVNGSEIDLLAGGTPIRAWVHENRANRSLENLVGASVRVRGSTGAIFNDRRQLLGFELHIPSTACVNVERGARTDPFGVPSQEIQSLAQFSANGQLARPVKISGMLTYTSGLNSFLQDENSGVRLRTRAAINIAPGANVEAVGLLESDGLSILMTDALVREVSDGHLSTPALLDPGDLPNREYDAKLVALKASLKEEVRENDGHFIFYLQNGGTVFKASLPVAHAPKMLPRAGSVLKITGVCNLNLGERAVESSSQGDFPFELYIPAAKHIQVLKPAPIWTAQRIAWAAGILALIVLFAGAWITMISRKNMLLRRAQSDLLKAHEELELRVQMRTEELARANAELRDEISERQRAEAQVGEVQRQLLHASRQAGMAEIATSVLHNVGNVLNSVNVSASVVASKLRNPAIAGLAKVATLLKENEQNIGTYIVQDPDGKKIPKLLFKLAEHFASEREKLVREMRDLTKGIDHVKAIVAMQQSYARAGGLVERIEPCELVEDAVQWNSASFERHGIKLEIDYGEVAPLLVEKHKALQILVNLLQNAKQACAESPNPEKRITVSVNATPEQRVRFKISDNGVGIAPENLTRIFGHGFTTRKNGHGFGLHSGALSAKEMGGSLTAESAGLGLGAVFTLELPIEPA